MKVFISSTVADLPEYRDAVRDALLGLGLETVSLDQLVASQEPVDAVFSELAASDLVVLVVGHRYGSIEPQSGKSWVEAEFEAARKLAKPILVFLAREDVPWPVAGIDIERSQIAQFREKLLSNYTVQVFATPAELAMGVSQSLSAFLSRVSKPEAEKEEEVSRRMIRIVRLLLSSPGDVADERERYSRAVFRFNQQEVEQEGIFIRLIRWEDMAPQIGPGPQNVINKQIGKYEIFSGIMWNRFGTPTDIAASGTEEEFRAAVESWKSSRKPWIVFYFCDRPVNFTNVAQLEQKRMVLRFRSELQQLGVVRSYSTPEDFENQVFQDLLRITSRPEFQKLWVR